MSNGSNTTKKFTTLRKPLLPRLDAAQLVELSGPIVEKSYRAGETIFNEGDSGKVAYLILSGAVRIWTHDAEARRVTLTLLGPNDFFGELAVLDGGPRSASASAEEDTILGGLKKEQMEHFLLTHPQAALHMIKQLGERLRQTNKLI